MKKIIITILAVFVVWASLVQAAIYNIGPGDDFGNLILVDSDSLFMTGGEIQFLTAYDGSLVSLHDGSIGWLFPHDDSITTINGGSVGELMASGNSIVTVNDVSIGDDLWAQGDSAIKITGGFIGDFLSSFDGSTIELSGGSIGGGLSASGSSIIYLYGSGFSVAGQTLKYGDSLRDYGTVGSYITGTITGILQDDSVLNNTFSIPTATNADIIVVPEPGTILMLGLGGFLIRRNSCLQRRRPG